MNEPAPFIPLANNSFDGLEMARQMLRSIFVGVLATIAKGSGYPFATLTSVATTPSGAPILLLSDLAHHTKNLRRDPRASILLACDGKGDPLAHPRLTVVGTLEQTADPVARRRFLRRNPKAALYADFPDFSFWSLKLEAAHLNGGFARAADYPGSELLSDISEAGALMSEEDRILDEINGAGQAYVAALASKAGRDNKGVWRATGLDPWGLDLQGPQHSARLVFEHPATDPAQWRAALAREAEHNSKTSRD